MCLVWTSVFNLWISIPTVRLSYWFRISVLPISLPSAPRPTTFWYWRPSPTQVYATAVEPSKAAGPQHVQRLCREISLIFFGSLQYKRQHVVGRMKLCLKESVLDYCFLNDIENNCLHIWHVTWQEQIFFVCVFAFCILSCICLSACKRKKPKGVVEMLKMWSVTQDRALCVSCLTFSLKMWKTWLINFPFVIESWKIEQSKTVRDQIVCCRLCLQVSYWPTGVKEPRTEQRPGSVATDQQTSASVFVQCTLFLFSLLSFVFSTYVGLEQKSQK